jgi:battenin
VIILAAAQDLVGASVPKGVVLLADILPSFLVKLVAPYFIHLVPYSLRISVLAAGSIVGMLSIALTPQYQDAGSISLKLLGVMLASLTSGGGEITFLALTHHYGRFSLAAWGSGTGGAGLIGAWAYTLATTSFGLSVRTSLLSFAFLPLLLIVSFFLILPRDVLKSASSTKGGYEPIESGDNEPEEEHAPDSDIASHNAGITASSRVFATQSSTPAWSRFYANLARAKTLFFP